LRGKGVIAVCGKHMANPFCGNDFELRRKLLKPLNALVGQQMRELGPNQNYRRLDPRCRGEQSLTFAWRM
jgi:hypothetical protein